jgi:cob(I)alamin adenosyltransferase
MVSATSTYQKSVVNDKIILERITKMKKIQEMFEALVRLKTDCYTAESSDDSSAIERDVWNYEKALASQDYFTDEQITNESVKRWNEMIAKMNEDYKKRNENK